MLFAAVLVGMAAVVTVVVVVVLVLVGLVVLVMMMFDATYSILSTDISGMMDSNKGSA